MSQTTLEKEFTSKEEWEEFLQSIKSSKIINVNTRSWFNKIKRYYKTYGWNMNIYEDQIFRLKQIKQEIENMK